MQGFWINQISQFSPTSFVTKVIMIEEERIGGWGRSMVIFINIWVSKSNLFKYRDTDRVTKGDTKRGKGVGGMNWDNRIDNIHTTMYKMPSLMAQLVKDLPAMQETQVRFMDWGDPLEHNMANHCSILAWRIPWTEELGRLQSMKYKESDAI